MNVVGAIRKVILDNAGVVALLSSNTSVYPVLIPQTETYPAVSLAITSGRPSDSKTQNSPIDNVYIDAVMLAKTYDEAQAIDTAIRVAIDGFYGNVTTSDSVVHHIDACRFLTRKDDFDEENVLFIRVATYDVRYYLV